MLERRKSETDGGKQWKHGIALSRSKGDNILKEQGSEEEAEAAESGDPCQVQRRES